MADRGRVGSLIVGCKSAAEKQWRREHEGHRNRIQSVRTATDMAPPPTMQMQHFRTNPKRERLLEDRYMEIDRENQLLLKKMSDAMKKPNSYIKEGQGSNKPTTLNRQGRKQDLIRITQENQRMLKAIQSAKPVYSSKNWEDSYRRSEVHLKNCSTYPVITRMSREKSAPSILVSLKPEDPEGLATTGSMGGTGTSLKQQGAVDDGQNAVFNEGMRIGEKYWLLQMATDGQTLTISAFHGETNTSLDLVVKEKRHRQLYREVNGDYSQIAQRLRIENDRLLMD